MSNSVRCLAKEAGALLCTLQTIMWDKCFLEGHSTVPEKKTVDTYGQCIFIVLVVYCSVSPGRSFLSISPFHGSFCLRAPDSPWTEVPVSSSL